MSRRMQCRNETPLLLRMWQQKSGVSGDCQNTSPLEVTEIQGPCHQTCLDLGGLEDGAGVPQLTYGLQQGGLCT